jgi:hypothetical protein
LRRFASLTGVSLIAAGLTALLFFAASARGASLPPLPLNGRGAVIQADGSGSGAETTTTIGGAGSGETTTTVGGTGSGATTTTTSASTTTTAAGVTTTTLASATTTTVAPCTTSPTLSVTIQSVRAGGSTGVNGACFARNVDITLTLFSDPVVLGTVRTDGIGSFSKVITIPSNTPVGNHTLTASGSGQAASITLVVSASGFGVTGLSWNLLILGLALIAAGVIVMAGHRIGEQDLIDFA